MGELFDESVVLSNDTGPSASSGLEAMAKNQRAIKELEGAAAPQSKTIASGSISPTAAYVIVDTEGSAAADDLDVISPVLSGSENLHDGMVLYLKAADSGRVVTVKNSSSANGINTYDGNDYVLSSTHWLKLQLRSGKWYEVECRAMEAAQAAATAAASAATTTARGIGRVATSADLVDGATINNGPAFLAAGVNAAVASAAGKVPVANASGKVPEWAFDVGDIMPSFSTAKSGFLLCNGGAYSRATYAGLFSVLGTAFGAGDGSTTFNVPDFRGKTIQGANANLMAVLSAGLPNITGRIGKTWTGCWTLPTNGLYAGAIAPGATSASTGIPSGSGAGMATIPQYDDFNAGWSNTIYGASTTVQPPAIAANIFIKY